MRWVCGFGPAAASPGWVLTRWPFSSFTALAWLDYSPSQTCDDRDKIIGLGAIVELGARPVITAAAGRLTGVIASLRGTSQRGICSAPACHPGEIRSRVKTIHPMRTNSDR
jgi:hypothetical protein